MNEELRMKDENVAVTKSFDFALRIIKQVEYLRRERKEEFILSKQVMRSGTSIGANIEEAIGVQSRKDFHAKISIAYKEARETRYWLRLLKGSEYLPGNAADSIILNCEEILKILGAIKKTTQDKN